MIGAKTIGHATLVAYDGEPVIATDPWLDDSPAYFGSWRLTHPIPAAELEEIHACRYVWISHGHPDHFCLESLERLRHATLLLPDHRGGRIRRELESRGFEVRVLPDGRWHALSPRIRISSIADVMQNAILLVDVGGRLFVDLNDASDRGWGGFVRSAVARHRRSYLLKLAPTGSFGILNVFDEDGRRLAPGKPEPDRAGAELATHADGYGVTHVIPFSSFFRCQRTDSAWANDFATRPESCARGFASVRGAEILPPFVEIDCERDDVRDLRPEESPPDLFPPEVFGDDWSDLLEADDARLVAAYFRRHESLSRRLGFVRLRVGGREHSVDLSGPKTAGITLEAPRASLVSAIRAESLDALLFGYFAKITVHGGASLVPAVVPNVTRYGDGGGARTTSELEAYLDDYRRRSEIMRDEAER